MKNTSLILMFILCLVFDIYGQNKNALDKYFESKEIIKDLSKIVSPNGVQENYQIKVGNIKQWVYVRGQDRNNPIILFVHGGPASPISPEMWTFQRSIE